MNNSFAGTISPLSRKVKAGITALLMAAAGAGLAAAANGSAFSAPAHGATGHYAAVAQQDNGPGVQPDNKFQA